MHSNPLDVFVTTATERKILEIFWDKVMTLSPRKRKTATEFAVALLRKAEAPKFADALAQGLTVVDKASN
jgi:hypothetical protein